MCEFRAVSGLVKTDVRKLHRFIFLKSLRAMLNELASPSLFGGLFRGKGRNHVINIIKKRFERGTRFVAYGKWEWDGRRNTFSLRLGKPDELEILPL